MALTYEHLRHLCRYPWHAIWHPHQRFWNIYTRRLSRPLKLSWLVRGVDTYLLSIESRLRLWGDLKKGQQLEATRVIYIDAGLHREGDELWQVLEHFGETLSIRAYGFEANPDHFERVVKRFADCSNVKLVNAALVSDKVETKYVSLYLAGQEGRGDSLFPDKGAQFIKVPCAHLSQYFLDEGINPRSDIIIIRMNIEGGELGVLEELQRARLLHYIDGWFGTWDDLFKIDPRRDKQLRLLKRRHGITSFPFNGRDLKSPRRRAVIMKLIAGVIARGVRRKSVGNVNQIQSLRKL